MNFSFDLIKEKTKLAWLSLSAREKSLVSLLGLVLFFFVVYYAISPLTSWIDVQKENIQLKENFLNQMRNERDQNVLAVARAMAFQEKISSEPLDLSAYLSKIAQKTLGADLSGLEPQKDQIIKGDIMARSVKLTCSLLTQRTLVQFLANIENNPSHLVYITGLRIRPKTSGKVGDSKPGELMDADVWVTTYLKSSAKPKSGS